jgi:hypothetical protein
MRQLVEHRAVEPDRFDRQPGPRRLDVERTDRHSRHREIDGCGQQHGITLGRAPSREDDHVTPLEPFTFSGGLGEHGASRAGGW